MIPSTPPEAPLNVRTNLYKAQRLWPPDFSKMDPNQQFRLEKKYRRRSKLAYQRPGWIKGVKLAQYGSVMFVVGYSVMFMDWGTMGKPFDGFRTWTKEKVALVWSVTTSQPARPNLGRIDEKSGQ